MAGELHLQWLLLIVLEAFAGLAVEALFAVEQIAGLVPYVAQMVDVEGKRLCCSGIAISGIDNLDGAAVLYGIAYLGIAHTHIFHEVTELELVLVAHFDDHAGVLGEESLYNVWLPSFGGGYQVMKIDMQAAPVVGEAHLQQGNDETTGRDVVSGHDPSAFDEFLNSIEGIGKVFGILHRRHVVAHLSKALCKGRSAKSLLVEGEVDMV